LPGKGNSSPVVRGGRVFLTAWDDAGKKRSVLCFDAKRASMNKIYSSEVGLGPMM
jgi:hypothetical protein